MDLVIGEEEIDTTCNAFIQDYDLPSFKGCNYIEEFGDCTRDLKTMVDGEVAYCHFTNEYDECTGHSVYCNVRAVVDDKFIEGSCLEE